MLKIIVSVWIGVIAVLFAFYASTFFGFIVVAEMLKPLIETILMIEVIVVVLTIIALICSGEGYYRWLESKKNKHNAKGVSVERSYEWSK